MEQNFVTLEKLMEILESQDKTGNTTPDLTTLTSGTATEPAVNPGFLPEHYDEFSLGLHPYDLTRKIDPVTPPTTPPVPLGLCVVGFFDQIGVTWGVRRTVENVVGYEIQRSTSGAFAGEETTMGTYAGHIVIDRNEPGAPYGPSVTRYYRIRAVAMVAGKPYPSAYSGAVSGTTLAVGATNTDLQTRIDTFVGCLQSGHITIATGLVSGTGTTGKLAKFTSATTIGDSIATETAGLLTIGGDLALTGKLGSYGGGAPTNGQLLIGNTSTGKFDKASLTAGTNITITPGAGTITIAATGGGTGTVTSVSGVANRITITGDPTVNPTVDIAATYVGQTSITTLGTIATGVWNAGALTTSGALTLTTAASKIVPGATSLSLRNNADSADNLLITNTGDVTIRNNLVVSGTGPHAIGGATVASALLRVTGTFPGNGAFGNVLGFEAEPTLQPVANQDAFLFNMDGTLQKASTGTHGDLAAFRVNPQFGAGASAVTNATGFLVIGFTAPASTTNASGIKITGPSGATNNYALWVAGGNTRFDGVLLGQHNVTTGSATGDVVLQNQGAYRVLNAAGTSAKSVMTINASDVIQIASGALPVQIPGSGLQMGSPTGGDKGSGTINVATDIYKNNTAYTNPDYVLEHWATGQILKHADKEGASRYRGLRSLEAVEKYARRTYTLPLMNQNRRGGLFGRGDLLMASVEEAYLYLFQHEKRLRELEARIQGL